MLLSTASAFADVSNQDVWGAWKGFMTGVGYSVSATERESGGVLSVDDLKISLDFPEDDGRALADLGRMTFTEAGDGTVRVGMPASFPVRIESSEHGDNTRATLTISMRDADLVASGVPENIKYDYRVAQMAWELTELVVNGTPETDATFNAIADTVTGAAEMSAGNTPRFAKSMKAERMTMTVKGDDPQEGMVDMQMTVAGLGFDISGAVPMAQDPEDPGAFFRAGFRIDGKVTQQGTELALMANDGSGPMNANMSTSGSSLAIKIAGGRFDYQGSVMDLGVNMAGAGIPLPIIMDMKELAYGIAMPLLQDNMAQDFSARFKLAGLTVSDMLWGVFDPGAMLPRDPATLAVAVNGTTTLFADLVASEGEDYPGELNSLTLSELLVDMVGARLSGSGAFTFDNTDMQTFDGMPRPEGSINLSLSGANRLIDTLVAMGLLPEEQAMGGRMMMAMFAVPGAGEDELTSVIEINADGHVLANGQRLQ
ncbi:DUF2125 domain-containing protein [Shimia sp.]|uniref:DUF2125 domain-containing protein n=1 Tax=Shimia sp. TaxID=1954381 RepID=UPI003561756E